MKILNIMTSDLNYNGVATVLLNYYNYIDCKDIQLDYLVPNKVDKELKEIFTRKGNKIFELYYHGKKMHQRRPVMYCIKLYKIIKENKYDVVHAHGSSSMLFLQLLTAKFAGIKVRIAHSHNTQSDFKVLHYLFKPLFKLSYTDAFACGTDAGKWLFGKNKKMLIIPNGKDSAIFSFKQDERIKYRKKYNLENKVVLGHVGVFNYQKNHDFLIEIFRKLNRESNKYFLILIGTGDFENTIKDKVKKYNLENNVLFLGQISPEKTANILNAMDIMLFPSRFEGFPNVLIEWQMNGLPCIISDKITREVKMTDLVYFESIDSIDNWINRVKKIKKLDRNLIKDNVIQLVKKSGFDIKDNAKMLEKEYLKLYEEKCNN